MISVIMPTYNKASFLNLTLASFVHQTSKQFELIIIDDGSSDDTEHIVQSYKNKLNLLYMKQPNLGRSQARNAGIMASSGTFLVFNDDDRIVRDNFIAEHTKVLMNDNDAMVIGGKGRVLTVWQKNKLPLRRNDKNILSERFGDEWQTISKSKYVELIRTDDLECNFEATINKIFLGNEFDTGHTLGVTIDQIPDFRLAWLIGTTANLSVRKDAVVDVGLFDVAFKGWGMEDTDLCYRLHMHGLKVKEYSSAYNYHQIHPIGLRWFNSTISMTRFNDLRKNILYFHKKTKSPSSFVYYKSFIYNIPTITANEIFIQFENALEKNPIPYSEWGKLLRTIMKNRHRNTAFMEKNG
jgi:glycosyltransferase involved in cell wall biosynthesis